MSQVAASAERGALVGAAGKSGTMTLSAGCSRGGPGWRNQAFQWVPWALLEARKHLRGSRKRWGLHIEAKRDLAGPKCFVHSGVETRKIFSSFVCLRERVGNDVNAQLPQWWGHWWWGRPKSGHWKPFSATFSNCISYIAFIIAAVRYLSALLFVQYPAPWLE